MSGRRLVSIRVVVGESFFTCVLLWVVWDGMKANLGYFEGVIAFHGMLAQQWGVIDQTNKTLIKGSPRQKNRPNVLYFFVFKLPGLIPSVCQPTQSPPMQTNPSIPTFSHSQ